MPGRCEAMAEDGVDARELIRQVRGGDREALESLLRCYRNYLCVLARSGLAGAMRAKVDASDVVQETMLAAFTDFAQFRGVTEGELLAWLRGILAHRLGMAVRRYRGTAARDLEKERAIVGALDRSSIALGNLVPARGPTPSQHAARRERGVILADALEALPDADREVVTLRVFRHLSWEEVGRGTGRSADAARMAWTRAIRKLGASLRELDTWSGR